MKIESPDHSVVFLVNGDKGQFYKSGRSVGGTLTVGDAELLWSPDSKAFILTTFLDNQEPVLAGASFIGGTPHVPDDLMVTIQKEFAKRHPKMSCAQEPGVAGLAWRSSSAEAVFVAEGQTVRCRPADGYFEAYAVSIPEGKIIQTYSMSETIRVFHQVLGPTLLKDTKLQEEEHTTK